MQYMQEYITYVKQVGILPGKWLEKGLWGNHHTRPVIWQLSWAHKHDADSLTRITRA